MNIGIIGCGTMGSGIAQVAATAGHQVVVYDLNEKALKKSVEKLSLILNRLLEKGRINEDKKENILNNINYSNSIADFNEADLVIEAIVENLDIKRKVFSELETIVSEKCIIATNTSSLSIASLAACLSRPSRFIGIHFFNPAPLMKLVEVIPAIQTDEEILNQTMEMIASWGKTVVKAKDTPGFIVNKVARPFYGEALRIYEEGLSDFATIDHAMRSIGGFRMGPFELMDFIGNDVNYTVSETVFTAFYYDARYKPSFTQKRLMEAGYFGRKSGQGYYKYTDESSIPEPSQDQGLKERIFQRILFMLINEAADTLHMQIANAQDIDLAMTNGVNYPKGLLLWADQLGINKCVNALDDLFDEYHEERYRCSPILRKLAKEGKSFF
ncbi:MAG: 3-hydroxybutyryl-CoA dehydrogenase [Verrucomicrobia bacterium]|nr:3-hydroxybutyryl-CoA dehydrogenase [Verrucomicrobiota bacterium]